MKLSKIDVNELTKGLGEYVRRKFYSYTAGGVKLDIREIDRGFCSEKAIDWKYLGVEHKANFYFNGDNKPNFFLELEFPRREGLKKRIEENSKSGKVIGETKFLASPYREYMEGEKKELKHYYCFGEYVNNVKINPEKDYYFVSCKIKKFPENKNLLFDALWGYLMRIPIGVAGGLIS